MPYLPETPIYRLRSEYKLWTDASSREFIAEHYPWFLDTFDNYRYPIQRADVIRYFILHHYGGVYMDLDIGCLRPMDTLLQYPVILPKTIPVGISNDLIFSEKGHPFMQQTVNSLVTFDHSWVLNYPTVMFSTGPMFLSAQYGIYTSSHPKTALTDIRVLPKSLYGKNAAPETVPLSFFSHFYGSSWHADDAAFIGFLGTWGKALMWVGLVVLIVGVVRLPKSQRRRGYELVLPRLSRSGRWYLPLRSFSASSSPLSTHPPSPSSLESSSTNESDVPVLRLPLTIDPPSPDADLSNEPFAGRTDSPLADVFRRVRNRVSQIALPREEVPMTPVRPRRSRYGRGVLFFLPAVFTTPSQDIELDNTSSPPRPSGGAAPPSYSSLSWHSSGDEKRDLHDVESAHNADYESSRRGLHDRSESTSNRTSFSSSNRNQ